MARADARLQVVELAAGDQQRVRLGFRVRRPREEWRSQGGATSSAGNTRPGRTQCRAQRRSAEFEFRLRHTAGPSILVELPGEQLHQRRHGGGGIGARGVVFILAPWFPSSVKRPMMLLAFTFTPFSSMISQANWVAVLTNSAAGRAWMP